MKAYLGVFVLSLFLVSVSTQEANCEEIPPLSTAGIEEVSAGLRTLLRSMVNDDGVRYLIPAVMRMSFHDCLDGCDGCINFNLPGNNGINETVAELEGVYKTVNCKLTRADFWALASKVAFEEGIKINNERCGDKPDCKTPMSRMRFLYGRQDCPTSPSHDNPTDVPSAIWDQPKIVQFFKEKFRFNRNNAVAVMGMHTLGKAGTPFRMAWEKNNTDGVTNNYYKNLLNGNLCWSKEMAQPEVTKTNHPTYFWRTRDMEAFALNCDMALIKNFKADPITGEQSCSYYDCGRTNTLGMFSRYAKSVSNWIGHINRLWPRILNVNQTQLKRPLRRF